MTDYEVSQAILDALGINLPTTCADPSVYSSGGTGGWGPEWSGLVPDWENGPMWNPFVSTEGAAAGGGEYFLSTLPDLLTWYSTQFSEFNDTGGYRFDPTTEPKAVHVVSVPEVLQVTFSPGADAQVTGRAAGVFYEVLGAAGIASVNVSSTSELTPSHPAESNHGVGDAFDMNFFNGNNHVGTNGEGYRLAAAVQAAALMNPQVKFVEGPVGNFIRDTPSSPWRIAAQTPTMNVHVHFDIFPLEQAPTGG